jgi:hypothetical protein
MEEEFSSTPALCGASGQVQSSSALFHRKQTQIHIRHEAGRNKGAAIIIITEVSLNVTSFVTEILFLRVI